MSKQAQAFVEGEGQQWLSRNEDKLPVKDDPVLEAIDKLLVKPMFVLEVGCANGWRLIELRKRYGCVCEGIDPGINVRNACFIGDFVNLKHGTAEKLNYHKGMFDAVIYGFCLYLCDPEDLFRIAAEGDRVLADGGYLIIYDFYSPYAYSKPYKHKAGLFSHKMDFSKFWLCHPAYRIVTQKPYGAGDDTTIVTVLQKQMKNSFPVALDDC